MENAQQLANRIREVLLNGTWIANTNCKEALSELNWQQATQKVESFNTLAALCFHINYYLEGLIQVFNGGSLEIRDKYSFDVPEISSQSDWDKLFKQLISNSETFIKHVEGMSIEELEAPFIEERYGSYRRNIEGVIEHSYYHLGQISLIKKCL